MPSLLALSDSNFIELINTALHNPYQDCTFLMSQVNKDGSTRVDFSGERIWGQTRVPPTSSSPTIPPIVSTLSPSSRAAFPLRLRNSEKYSANRVVLIGYGHCLDANIWKRVVVRQLQNLSLFQ